MSNLLLILGLFIVLVIFPLLLIKIGWSLFMVPVFGLNPLTVGQALGLSMLISTFRTTKIKG